MKKNWTIKAGVVLVALTLMTSCFVGSTFAKYVTAGNGTDTARVAKWGVEVSATGTAFATEYEKADADIAIATNSVVSSDGDKVLAPGTSGSLVGVAITGTPEVAVKVTAEVTKFEVAGAWVDNDGNAYFPIAITVNGTKYAIGTGDIADFAALQTAVKNAVAGWSKYYDVNTDLSTIEVNDKLAISWEWAFEGNGYQNDVKDTALGDAAVDADLTFTIEVSTTVTQVD